MTKFTDAERTQAAGYLYAAYTSSWEWNAADGETPTERYLSSVAEKVATVHQRALDSYAKDLAGKYGPGAYPELRNMVDDLAYRGRPEEDDVAYGMARAFERDYDRARLQERSDDGLLVEYARLSQGMERDAASDCMGMWLSKSQTRDVVRELLEERGLFVEPATCMEMTTADVAYLQQRQDQGMSL